MGYVGAVIIDMAVCRDQIEPAVVIEVEKSHAESEPVAACHREAVLRGMVAEYAVAQVLVQGRVFAVKVGDGQVGQAIAVQVAASDSHARCVDARVVAGDAGDLADLFKVEAAPVQEQELGRLVIGDEQVDPPITIKVIGHDAEAFPGLVENSRLGRDIDETSAVIAEEVVGHRREFGWPAKDDYLANIVPAAAWVLAVPVEVVANVKIEVAIAVEISERCRGRPVAVTHSARPCS